MTSNNTVDAGGEVGGGSSRRLKGGEARAACLRDGRAGAPFRDPDQVDRGGGEDVLQARFGQADVAAPAQAAAVDGLRVRALNAGAGSIVYPERPGFLLPARAL